MLKRWIIRGLFMLPILLCVYAWAVSTRHTFSITCWQENSTRTCGLCEGMVYLERDYDVGLPEVRWSFDVDGRGAGYFVRGNLSRISPSCFLGFARAHMRVHFEASESFDAMNMVSAPLWFFLLCFSALLFLVWRKTRPKIDPRTAFPVVMKA